MATNISRSLVQFSAQPDGSVRFSIEIAGTHDREGVLESVVEVQRILRGRMRFDETAIQLGDIIVSLPNSSIQAYVDQCYRALQKSGEL